MSTQLRPQARTSLRHVGGPSTRRGDDALADKLEQAFAVDPNDPKNEDAGRAHVHGFHSYPARIHPVIARGLVRSLGSPGQTFLDPFCGSGTLLVEARMAGMLARGTDVNPLALRLAQLKTRGVPKQQREELVAGARAVAKHAEDRRNAKARVTHKYGPEDVDLFEPHVLMELDALFDGLKRIEPVALREDVELVFSAILTKVSRKRGDTSGDRAQRRLPPGFVGRMLISKAEELSRGLEAYLNGLPKNAPPCDVHSDDARVLGTIAATSVDLIVTSPPYAATYDYVGHHDVRLRWLALRIDRFEKLELGARRDYATLSHDRAQDRWDDELGRSLAGIGRALKNDGVAVLVLADSAVRGGALRADETVERLAPEVGLDVRAVVSQVRPHFHTATLRTFAARPRQEHLIALGRSALPRDARGALIPRPDSRREGAPREDVRRVDGPPPGNRAK